MKSGHKSMVAEWPDERPDVNVILGAASSWQLLGERQARETKRSVFLVDGRYTLKKFEIPATISSFRRPWEIEDKALRRLGGSCAPRGLGWVEESGNAHRTFWLAKEYLPGETNDRFAAEDIPAVARAMAGIHRRLIITDDANVHNFLKRPDGSIVFIDFGRARNFMWRSPWFYWNVGWELAKLFREGFMRDRAGFREFLVSYFQQADYTAGSKMMITLSMKFSAALRVIRKMLQGKSPWS